MVLNIKLYPILSILAENSFDLISFPDLETPVQNFDFDHFKFKFKFEIGKIK